MKIDGMTCDGCARSVEKALIRLDPAARIAIDLARGTLEIESRLSEAELAAAVILAGYEVGA